MDLFTCIEAYGLPVCRACKVCVLPAECDAHIRRLHKGINKKTRAVLVKKLNQGDFRFKTRQDLEFLQLPTTPVPFFPELDGPHLDGFRCKECPYIIATLHHIQAHCRKQHNWINPVQRGQRGIQRAETTNPWRINVPYQRFFAQGLGSAYFEVIPRVTAEAGTPVPAESIQHLLDTAVEEMAGIKYSAAVVSNTFGTVENNPWVERVGWAEHFNGVRYSTIRQLVSLDVDGTWPEELELRGSSLTTHVSALGSLSSAVESVVREASMQAGRIEKGSAVLFELSRESNKPNNHPKPFRPFSEPETLTKYLKVWQQVVLYIYRSDIFLRSPAVRFHLWRFTPEQNFHWDLILESIKIPYESLEPEDRTGLNKLILDFMISLLDHSLPGSVYDNALISALAAMGLGSGDTWLTPRFYTSKYSAVIRIAKYLVIYQSQLTIENLDSNGDDDSGLFDAVRERCSRFLRRCAEGNRPTPVDWILNSRAYGMTLAQDEAMDGSVVWTGNSISYKESSFSMEGLVEVAQGLVQKLATLVDKLLFVEYGSVLPDHPSVIKDDFNDRTPGNCFINHPENKDWVTAGEACLYRQVLTVTQLRDHWIRGDVNSGVDVQLQHSEAAAYLAQVNDFRKLFLVAVHLLGGQPARATEILPIRFINTHNGGLRNLYVRDGRVCIQTSYHKGYSITGMAKLIYRFLPEVLTPVFVRYIWLVLPFAQFLEMKVSSVQGAVATPWMWSNNHLRPRPSADEAPFDSGSVRVLPQAQREDLTYSEYVWSSDKMRRVLEAYTQANLGCKLNIHDWRHVAIAIGRRYIKDRAFIQQDDPTNPLYEDSDTEHEAEPNHYLDLQATHTTKTAEFVYARGHTDFGNVKAYGAFLDISESWHKLLGFGKAQDFSRNAQGHHNLMADLADVHIRRLRHLRSVNFDALLANELRKPGSRLRPHQKAVLQAIVLFKNPILYVTATGQGKTMSFLLPAVANTNAGTTVVIVPFVVLQEDLRKRLNRDRPGLCTVWNPEAGRSASPIVLVSPEFLDHPLWLTFADSLARSFRLDRIVLDECHTILDTDYRFRPKLRNIRTYLFGTPTQLLFLTGSLQPRCEAEFWSLLGLYPLQAMAQVLRSPTNRPDITYRAVRVEARGDVESHVVRLVKSYLEGRGQSSFRFDSAPRGRVIVYCTLVEQVKSLARRLNCPMYYSSVGTPEQKQRIIDDWANLKGPIVATNALGQGLNHNDIRLIVHCGPPTGLRTFVQETGRASRDGQGGFSIVVYSAEGLQAFSSGKPDHQEVLDFMEPVGGCRRQSVVMAMDGMARTPCRGAERFCDLCTDHHSREETRATQQVLGVEERRAADGLVMPVLNQARHATEVQNHAEEFRTIFEYWRRRCICSTAPSLVRKPGWRPHRPSDCPYKTLWGSKQRDLRSLQMERYSGCFRCRVPQSLCTEWAGAVQDGGSFQRTQGACIDQDLVISVVACVLTHWKRPEGYIDQVRTMVQGMGARVTKTSTIEEMMVRKLRWGDIEASVLAVFFWHIGKIAYDEQQEEERNREKKRRSR